VAVEQQVEEREERRISGQDALLFKRQREVLLGHRRRRLACRHADEVGDGHVDRATDTLEPVHAESTFGEQPLH
jgi:hypothetical protein